jgi:tRNA U38,U39,U40 pseudouridine synthase TruA
MFRASIEKCENKLFGLNKDERNEVYYFYFVANSFLWHQIRYMTTILFLVGSGREKPEIVDELLDVAKTTNKPNYPAAPEFPLILEDCKFKDLEFQITKEEGVNMCNTLNTIIMTRVMEMTLYVNCLTVM